MAVPAAVSVHNARMFRREAEQNRRLQALLAAGRAMNSTIRLNELLATIARRRARRLDTAGAPSTRTTPAETTRSRSSPTTRETPSPGWEQWVGAPTRWIDFPTDREMLLGGEIVEERVSDPALDERSRQWMLDNGEKALLNVPPRLRGRAPMGLLVFIETETERHFTREERELAAALAEQAAAAIHHAELLEQTERQNRQLGLLLESTRAISTSVELDEVLAIVARTTAEALGAEQCQIQEYDAAANTVTPIAFWQRQAERPEPDSMHKTFSLADEPEERAFLEAKAVVQQLLLRPRPAGDRRGRSWTRTATSRISTCRSSSATNPSASWCSSRRTSSVAGATTTSLSLELSASRPPSRSSTRASTGACRTRRSPTASRACSTTATSTSVSIRRSPAPGGTARRCRC